MTMKKTNNFKPLIFLIALATLLFPNAVLADPCTSPKISGDASSFPSHNTGSCDDDLCCDGGVCLWHWNPGASGTQGEGVRIQIYKYTEGGTPSMVGNGVDIWATNDLRNDNYHYSNPSTPNLNKKVTCVTDPAERTFGETYGLSLAQYIGTGHVYYDNGLSQHFASGTVNDFLLVRDGGDQGEVVGGWIYDNFFSKIISGENSGLQDLQTLFGLSQSNVDDILKNKDDYYITAEVLYQFIINSKNYEQYERLGAIRGHVYNGTASEGGYFHGANEVYNALQGKGEVGKLSGPASTYKIYQRNTRLGVGYWRIDSGSKATNKEAACNSAWGYAEYNMGCGSNGLCLSGFGKTCSLNCSRYQVGTKGHTECAKNYCSDIPEGSQEEGKTFFECMNTCDSCEDVCEKASNKEECAKNYCSGMPEESQDECINTCTQPLTCEEECKDATDDTCAENWCSANAGAGEQDKCVEECRPKTTTTCQEDCSGKKGADLVSCAKQWCDGKNDPDCVSQCTPPEILYWDDTRSEGCQEEFKDTCSGYILDDEIYATSKQFTCSSTLINPNYSLSSRICDDDEGKYNEDLNDIYYKVECQEDLNLSGLPSNKLNLHFSVAGSASMYLGYNLDYKKTCKLWFKKARNTTTPTVANDATLATNWFDETNSEWVQAYSNTQAQYDLKRVEELIKEIERRKKDINDMGITTSTSVSASSLKEVLGQINTLDGQNVRGEYKKYLYPSDKPANRDRLTCDDWLQYNYVCHYGFDCSCNYVCDLPAPCLWPGACANCNGVTPPQYYKSYIDPPATLPTVPWNARNVSCGKEGSLVDLNNDSATCHNYEDKVKQLLGYYNLALQRLNKMKDFLSKVEQEGKHHLDLVKEDDYKEGTVELKHDVKIDLVTSGNSSSKETVRISLIPITCITKDDKTERYCEFENAVCHPEQNGYSVDGDNHVTCDTAKAEFTNEYTTVYSYTIAYGLPSSYLMTLSENAEKVYHAHEGCTTNECIKNECEADRTGAAECVEQKNVWVFDPVTKKATTVALEDYVESGDFHIEMSGIGMCPFSAKLDCSYQLSSYKECADCGEDLDCLKEKCGCESYCGSNETCMYMYCPEECEACGEYGEETCSRESTCDECLPTCDAYKGSNNEKYAQCKFDCCSMNCNAGDQACAATCCFAECNDLYSTGSTEYQACINGCNNPGGDYIFRPIDMNRPFPEREPGANWSGKVEYITRSNDINSRYYDRTDGRSNDDNIFEYKVTLKAGNISEIRRDYAAGNQTTYKDFERPNNDRNKKYCSKFLHEYLGEKLVDNSGSGC